MAGDEQQKSEKQKSSEEIKAGSTLAVPTKKRKQEFASPLKGRKRDRDEDPMATLVFETRLLVAATAAILIAILLWTVSVATHFWFHVSAPETGPIYINRTNTFFVSSHSGIWTICKYTIPNDTKSASILKTCHNHRLFPTYEQLQKNTEVDRTILDYTRTEIAFAIISYCVLGMGLGFSIYTFKEPRYTFKRLAGGVHFISAAAILVVIEVVVNSVKYEEQYLTDRHPKGALWSYGYSFIIAWVTFVVLILSGSVFIFCSRKRKGDRGGLGSGADDPHIIGRM